MSDLPRLVSHRAIKRLAARCLPEPVKARLRGRLYGYHAPRIALRVDYAHDERGPILVLDDRIRMPFQHDEREMLEHHLAGASLEETAGILSLAKDARVLFDVGAATALYSRLFCASGPDHRSVAFDASPAQIEGAAARIAHAGSASRIRLRSCAVGQTTGRATVAIADNHYASVTSSSVPEGTMDVEITTLDHEVDRIGIVPDLLKIDIEGFEYEALIGARRLLASRKPPICLELHLGLLERRGIHPRQVVDELESHGYRFRTYCGRRLSPVAIWDSMHAILRFVAE